MESTTRLLLPEVQEALETNPEGLSGLISELHPADLADLVSELDDELAIRFMRLLDVDTTARLIEHMGKEQRTDLFTRFAEANLEPAAAVTAEMAPDDRADLFADLELDLRTALLSAVAEPESKDIRLLLAYPEGSAGALMTTDFVALPADVTASEAIDIVRKSAEETESVYQAYAVDPHRTLLGAISLRDLVTSPARRSVDAIMNPKIVAVNADADQEEVARLISKYDLLAVPVVDKNHRIVGMVTVDDVMDVVEEEATEDVQRLGAVEPLDQSYVATPIWSLVKARLPWLIVLFAGVLFTRNVLEYYHQSGIDSVAMLMWFVPLVVSAGGNSGSQSATLVIRALAVGRLELKQTPQILVRELLVGMMLGSILAILGVASVWAWESSRQLGMVLTMAGAVTAVVTLGALLGSGVPLLLEKLKIDPAVSSTPFIASLVDVAGLILYFEIARLFLP